MSRVSSLRRVSCSGKGFPQLTRVGAGCNVKGSCSFNLFSRGLVSATATLRKTPLNGLHRRLGAKMVDFGGWDMPVEYSGLIAEHMAVRTGVGLFDVSHMGDIQFRGPGFAGGGAAYFDERRVAAAGRAGAVFGDAVSGGDVCGRRDRAQIQRQRLSVRDQCGDAGEGLRVGAGAGAWVRLPRERLQRLLHAAGDPGTEGAGDAAEADERGPEQGEVLLVHLGHGVRAAEYADRADGVYGRGRV